MHRKSSSPKKANRSAPETRPRRRASQTYFIKYQLARNPLKAEEEDLKLALLASLQQCNETNNGKNEINNGLIEDSTHNTPVSKATSTKLKTYSLKSAKSEPDDAKKVRRHKSLGVTDQRSSVAPQTPGNRTDASLLVSGGGGGGGGGTKRSANKTLNSSSTKRKKLANGRHRDYKSVNYSTEDKNIHSSNNNNNNNNINQTATYTTTSKTRLNHHQLTNGYDNSTTNNMTASYSPYAPIQKKEPPDEDYLRKYKPETEDFLTFICFRTTAPNYNNFPNDQGSNGVNGIDGEIQTNPKSITTNGNTKHTHNNLKKRASPSSTLYSLSPSPDKLIHNNMNSNSHNSYNETNTNGNEQTDQQQNHSPNNRRRPIRQSPRLATRQSKRFIGSNRISENDHTATAYDNSIDYEEELKRVSIALEDMAQEINSSEDVNGEGIQSLADNNCKTPQGSPLFKNNRHLVKGLMTREFAGAFADEETIFESISNHKL